MSNLVLADTFKVKDRQSVGLYLLGCCGQASGVWSCMESMPFSKSHQEWGNS